MTEEEKIAKILKDGHMIAYKIKAAQTISVHCVGLEKENLTARELRQ